MGLSSSINKMIPNKFSIIAFSFSSYLHGSCTSSMLRQVSPQYQSCATPINACSRKFFLTIMHMISKSILEQISSGSYYLSAQPKSYSCMVAFMGLLHL